MAVMCTDNIIATLESHAKLNGGRVKLEVRHKPPN